jgi:hypothetical protein
MISNVKYVHSLLYTFISHLKSTVRIEDKNKMYKILCSKEQKKIRRKNVNHVCVSMNSLNDTEVHKKETSYIIFHSLSSTSFSYSSINIIIASFLKNDDVSQMVSLHTYVVVRCTTSTIGRVESCKQKKILHVCSLLLFLSISVNYTHYYIYIYTIYNVQTCVTTIRKKNFFF